MNSPEPGKLLAKVRCNRCGARLFDTRFVWRPAEVSSADLVVKCWRCDKTVGIHLDIPGALSQVY